MKTLLDLLMKGGLAGSELVAFLTRVGNENPDFKPLADQWIGKLNAAITPAGLAELGQTVIRELAELPTKGIRPKPHPSDLV